MFYNNTKLIFNSIFLYQLFWDLNLDFLNKFNIFNYHLLPKINKVVLTITIGKNLKNTTDIKIINNLSILDFFFIKKANVDTLLSKYIKKKKTIIFVTTSTLNSFKDLFFLLFILKKIIVLNLSRKFIYFNYKINYNNFFLKIEDISSLDELYDNLKKEKVGLKISFHFNISDKKLSTYFFKTLGF